MVNHHQTTHHHLGEDFLGSLFPFVSWPSRIQEYNVIPSHPPAIAINQRLPDRISGWYWLVISSIPRIFPTKTTNSSQLAKADVSMKERTFSLAPFFFTAILAMIKSQRCGSRDENCERNDTRMSCWYLVTRCPRCPNPNISRLISSPK